ncbi:hypothetical protein BJ912DRAFT_933590, partial [Pholiota molesta]
MPVITSQEMDFRVHVNIWMCREAVLRDDTPGTKIQETIACWQGRTLAPLTRLDPARADGTSIGMSSTVSVYLPTSCIVFRELQCNKERWRNCTKISTKGCLVDSLGRYRPLGAQNDGEIAEE